MERITQLGTELAMLLRREHEHLTEAARIGERIETLTQEIQQDTSGTLYSTGAFPVVRPAVPASVQLRRTEEPVEEQPPSIWEDGNGLHTIVPCPDDTRGVDEPPACPEEGPHIHTADGEVHPTRLVET